MKSTPCLTALRSINRRRNIRGPHRPMAGDATCAVKIVTAQERPLAPPEKCPARGLGPQRMIQGASAVGERCWQRSQQTQSDGVTRRRSSDKWSAGKPPALMAFVANDVAE